MFKKIILTQDMKKDMILHSIAKRLVRNGRICVRQGAHYSSLTGVLRLFVLLFLLMVGVENVWADGYEGFYYIANYTRDNSKAQGYVVDDPAGNYYLCPAALYYNGDPEMPYLTTKRTNQGANSIWELRKDPETSYYYIIHYEEGGNGRYLVHNAGPISGKENRFRVHLEANPTLVNNNNVLFTIEENNGTFKISPNADTTNPKRSLNPASGNKDSYTPFGNENISGTTYATGGIIGLWAYSTKADDAASRWYLEKAAPIIRYNSDNTIKITYPVSGASIYYSFGDDSTPVAGTNSYSEPFNLPSGTTTIKAIAIKDGEQSGIATYKLPFLLGSTHKYIIQSENCQFYRLIPNVSVDDNTKYLSTLNVPSSTMSWHFEYAEDFYYYIVDENGWYMYYTDNTDKYIYLKRTKDDDDDGFKFNIEFHANGGYNIMPKGQALSIYKNNYGSNDAGLIPVMYDGTITEDVARWDLIPYSTTNLPMWEDAPFTVSTDAVTNYYTITPLSKNTDSDRRPLIINGSGDVNSEVVPNGLDERKTMWVIKKVGAYDATDNETGDDNELLDFYTLQNAYTGELLFYNGNGNGDGHYQSTTTFQMGIPSVTDANEKWAHFVIVQTANNGYNIIPRIFVDNLKAINRTVTPHYGFNCLNRSGGKDILGTFYDDGDGSRWMFSQVNTTVKCIEPVFTEEANGDITITTVTNAAKILYTINDVNNPNASSDEYTTKENTSAQKIIKAIAIMGDDANTASSVVTLLNMPEITLDQSTYPYDGTAKTPTPSKVYIGTTETTSGFGLATTTPYLNNINAGTATVNVEDNDPTDSWYIWNATADFIINKASVTVKADDKTKGFGDIDPTFTATVTGLKNSDAPSVISYTFSRTEGENFGDYTITPSGNVEQGNYKVDAFVTGTLTITRKAIGDGTTPADGIDIDITYDGSNYHVTVKQGDNTLEEGDTKDYTWEGSGTDTYVVTVTGHGNYDNSAQVTYIKHDFYDTTPDDPSLTETAAVYYATQNMQVSNEFDAYYVTSLENNELTIRKVEGGEGENKISYIPAGQPVLLLSKTGATSKPLGFTLKSYTGAQMTFPAEGEDCANLLKVVTDEGGKSVALTEVYIFSVGEFVLSMAGTMSKGMFYLENPVYNTPAPARQVLRIRRRAATNIDNNEITDIDSQSMDIWYTIDGRRLSSKPMKKGLYIKRSEKGKSGSVTVIK